MNIGTDPRLGAVADAHPYPLLFATVSGAHLCGFASADSDVDLRGVHVLPWREVVGLEVGSDTIERMGDASGLDLDLVTHDAAKFFRLMLRPNGYVLEQLFSPLVVRASATLEELRTLGEGCVTRWHSRHYLGFAATQWRLFRGDQPRRVKPLLYTYRVLLTGIRLMRTGKVEANLRALNEEARLSHVDDLIACKVAGAEKEEVDDASLEFHAAECAPARAAGARGAGDEPAGATLCPPRLACVAGGAASRRGAAVAGASRAAEWIRRRIGRTAVQALQVPLVQRARALGALAHVGAQATVFLAVT